MPKPKPWPRRADEQRMDLYAIGDDIEILTSHLHAAYMQGDGKRVLEINLKFKRMAKRIKELTQEAKRA